MKNPACLILAIIVFSLFSYECLAQNTLDGIVVPVSKEKINIVTGDRASVNLGEKHGITKGDIGSIVANDEPGSLPVGRCAVVKSNYQSSVCEVIRLGREIESGSLIRFPKVTYTDATIFPVVIGTLSNIFRPYAPHEKLRVCLHGIYNSRNAVTALSEEIQNELISIFSQKKRIELVDKSVLKDLVFYPDADSRVLGLVKEDMKRANIDVLIMGKYTLSQDKVDLAITKIDKSGDDNVVTYTFPSSARYAALSAKILVTPEPVTEIERSSCLFSVRSMPYRPRKDEKDILIKHESAGDPITELHLRRIEFNLLNAVDARVAIDGEVIPMTENLAHVQLARGLHRIAVSFRRAFFFNDSLLYTSQHEIRKEAFLDISTNKNIVVEVRLDPLYERDTIAFNVYEPVQRERQVIKPIYRAEAEKVLERFKD